MIQGEMTVDNFLRRVAGSAPNTFTINASGSAMLKTGDIDYRADDSDLHRCTAKVDAITLHICARPVANYRVYDLETGIPQDVRSTYDAIVAMERQ